MELQPVERRRRKQREDARRAMLDATEALLVEGGYESFSMRKLAARCGYTAPTIYHYFADKPDLIDTLLEERFRKLVSRLRRVKRHADPLEDARVLCTAFVHFGLRHPTHYQLLSAPREKGWTPPASAERARSLLEEPLEHLAAEGRLRAADPEAIKQTFWALLHGVISLRNARHDIEWSATLLDDALDALFRGFLR